MDFFSLIFTKQFLVENWFRSNFHMKFKYSVFFFSFRARCCFELQSSKITFFSIDNVLVFSLEAFTRVSSYFFGEKDDVDFVVLCLLLGCLESHFFGAFNGGLTFQTVMRFIEFLYFHNLL